MRKHTALLFIILVGLLFAAPGQAAAKSMLATGERAFQGELGKQGQAKGDKDEFIFKGDKFRSTACDPYGFGETKLIILRAGNDPAKGERTEDFTAVATSPTDGKMTWRGTYYVRSGRIEGTALWEKPGQPPVKHWFKGELKK